MTHWYNRMLTDNKKNYWTINVNKYHRYYATKHITWCSGKDKTRKTKIWSVVTRSGNWLLEGTLVVLPKLHRCHSTAHKKINFTKCKLSIKPTLKTHQWGLPWWRSVWESACQCGGHGFEPWSGRIPHAEEQLGPWATTAEPARLEPVLRNGRGRDSERPAHRDEE